MGTYQIDIGWKQNTDEIAVQGDYGSLTLPRDCDGEKFA